MCLAKFFIQYVVLSTLSPLHLLLNSPSFLVPFAPSSGCRVRENRLAACMVPRLKTSSGVALLSKTHPLIPMGRSLERSLRRIPEPFCTAPPVSISSPGKVVFRKGTGLDPAACSLGLDIGNYVRGFFSLKSRGYRGGKPPNTEIGRRAGIDKKDQLRPLKAVPKISFCRTNYSCQVE